MYARLLAATLGGSGFLAVYLAGVVLGNSRLVFKRGIFLFHDGMAWLSQITMFVVLGLLSFPSRLLETASSGLLVAAVLVFVARPVAAFGLLWPFGFRWRELLFISWAGLKGAVPVILGTYPLLFGLPDGSKIFDVIFFVVLISAILQGSTLGWLARRLGIIRPASTPPPASLEITSIRDVDGDILDYPISHDSPLAGVAIRDLSLPDGALVALITRDSRIIPPRGSTRIWPADHLFVVMRSELRPVIDRLFAGSGPAAIPPRGLELQGGARLADLAALYGLDIGLAAADRDGTTLASLLHDHLGDRRVEVGAYVVCGHVRVEVTELRDGVVKRARIERVSEVHVPTAAADEG
ncbi:cation:proton antiporter domain-containing protein [Enhygromyxa salina]|uniref:K(+)/H(+) antiporter NhaP2 n=1 Tax=Enhygromyxa salina TaxID=215803 RepID=A0A2S9YJH7_9BACT|nr:cation:proton antiporter [Enhygromyxa salina]PRQ05231.1 K(+)/H(+) antiporter NhaP2 [Enhygromyxa salina]